MPPRVVSAALAAAVVLALVWWAFRSGPPAPAAPEASIQAAAEPVASPTTVQAEAKPELPSPLTAPKPATEGDDDESWRPRTYYDPLGHDFRLIRVAGSFSLADMLDPDFVDKRVVWGLLICVRGQDQLVQADEIRDVYERLAAEGFEERVGALLRLPFAEDFDADDHAWLQEKASKLLADDLDPADLLDAVACVHALRLAGTYDRAGDMSPLWRLGHALLDALHLPQGVEPPPDGAEVRAASSGVDDLAGVRKKALICNLANLDELGGPLDEPEVQRRLFDPTLDAEVRGALLSLYARAGGPKAAQWVIAEAAAGDDLAIEALREVRDPSVTQEIAALAERSLSEAGSGKRAAHALAALAGMGTVEAYEVFRRFLSPAEDLPEASRRARREAALKAYRELAKGPLVSITTELIRADVEAGVFGAEVAREYREMTFHMDRPGTRPGLAASLSRTTHERYCDSLRRLIDLRPPGQRGLLVLTLADWARESDIPFVLGELNAPDIPPVWAEQVRESFRTGEYKWNHG